MMLTTKELAARWAMSLGSLSNLRGSRKGPKYIKLGRGKGSRVLYRLADVEAYEKKMTIATLE